MDIQTDYILSSSRFDSEAVQEEKTSPGADCYSDNVPMKAEIKIEVYKYDPTEQVRSRITYTKK